MRLVSTLLICLLVEAFALAEDNRITPAPRPLQDKFFLYVSSQPGGGQGRLVKFDSETGEKTASLAGAGEPVDVAVGPDDYIFATDQASGAADVRRFNPDTGQADSEPYGETSGNLGGPRGLAFGPDGSLYVADMVYVFAEVVKFDETGKYVEVLADDPDNPVLLAIEDVACDGSGRIYVTQWAYAGDEVPGVFKFTGTGWTLFGQTGDLVLPWGLTFGPDGDLYVADTDIDHFGVFRYSGTTGASKGAFGTTGSEGNLGEPRYLTFSPDGDLYVTDALDSSVKVFSGPLKPDAGTFKGAFGQTPDNVPEPFGLVFASETAGPQQPELLIGKLLNGNMLVTLTGTEGKSYELRHHLDPTVSDFTQWTFGATINLEGTNTGTWEDDTAASASTRFYKAKEQ